MLEYTRALCVCISFFPSLYIQKWNCSAIWQLLSFLRNCQTALQIPHILAKKSLSSVLFHYNHSVGVKLYHIEALICMTLMTNDFDHFSGIYCPISISPLGGKWLGGSMPIVLLFFWETENCFSSVAKDDLELLTLQPPPPKCWNYRPVHNAWMVITLYCWVLWIICVVRRWVSY